MPAVELDFRLLFEEAPDILLVLLPDAPRFTMVAATRARYAATLTGPDSLGKGLFEVFPDNPDEPGATGTTNLRESLNRVVATRAADSMAVQKYDIRRPDGTFEARYWSPRNIPVLSEDGTLRFIIHRVEDVTELVRASELGEELRGLNREMEREVLRRSQELADANRSLRDANLRLGELDKTKTAFFSNVSHEFRTPLTLMIGPLEDCLGDQDEALTFNQRQRVQLAHDNALRLLKLVNGLLDFSRMEAGRFGARYAPTDFSSLTREIAGMFESAAERAHLGLVVDAPALSASIWLDRGMWEKVVSNLMSNALKYTHEGGVTVRVSESEDRALLEVTDTGIGIPAAELERVFERFHRIEGVAGRTYEGTGIGLSLVRDLVRLHGGEVRVVSEVGRGSTFRVEIPKGFTHLPPEQVSATEYDGSIGDDVTAHAVDALRWAAPSATAAATGLSASDPRSNHRAHLVVVDDNPDLRSYLLALLSPAYDVTACADGEAGLAEVRRRPPDLVLTDVMMPKLDGFALLKALRADPRTSSIPVILLSARAGEEATIEGLDVGADDYLAKPFSARELLARVRTNLALARLRERLLADLERANRDLDSFAYSVSHDLKAPIRAIAGFSQILAEDYDAALDDRGRDVLAKIERNAKQMAMMTDALLALGRIGRAPLRREPVDLTAAAEGILGDLRRESPDRSVLVSVAPRLETQGDPVLLGLVLTNLLSNAWKYTSKTSGAEVELGSTSADEPTYFVRDNGAGFDMAQAPRLFQPFQRLHAPSDFPGFGVGLATVKRAVERHGGRIWARSEVGKGATFYFTFPFQGEP